MASALLQLNPENRIGADDGSQHLYFAQLPKKLYELPDGNLTLRNYFKIILNFFIFVFIYRNINFHRGRSLLASGAES